MASHLSAFIIRDLIDFETEIKGKRILEVGSASWTWESIKEHFMGCKEFISVDLQQRPETDYICDAENLIDFFGLESFEFIVSLFMIEHVKDWKKVISNFKHVCAPGGTILIASCTQQFPFHDSYDAWRFEDEDIQEIFSDCEIEFIFMSKALKTPGFLIFAKIKKPIHFIENCLDYYTLFNINSSEYI